jgi:hypothetical protein
MKGGGKIQRFFRWPNSYGQPAQVEKFSIVKIFQKQFQCSPFQVGLPLDGFRLEFFSNEICKNHCRMSQSLYDMHASLPDLKYRSSFLLNLLVVLIAEDLLPLI